MFRRPHRKSSEALGCVTGTTLARRIEMVPTLASWCETGPHSGQQRRSPKESAQPRRQGVALVPWRHQRKEVVHTMNDGNGSYGTLEVAGR